MGALLTLCESSNRFQNERHSHNGHTWMSPFPQAIPHQSPLKQRLPQKIQTCFSGILLSSFGFCLPGVQDGDLVLGVQGYVEVWADGEGEGDGLPHAGQRLAKVQALSNKGRCASSLWRRRHFQSCTSRQHHPFSYFHLNNENYEEDLLGTSVLNKSADKKKAF